MVSAWHVGGTRGSCIVLGMGVVRGMRGVGGVCEMCLSSGRRGRRGGGLDERIVFGLYQSCGNKGSVGHVFGLRWCMWGVGRGLGPGSRVVLSV